MGDGVVKDETRRVRSVFGTGVGGYRVVDEIARGGMGIVYLGEHPVLGSHAALKVLKDRYAQTPELIARFELEARAQARVSSGRVVRLYDFVPFVDGRGCIVMEHVPGDTLEKVLEARRKLPVPEATRLLLQLAATLADVHRAKVIHCDVKAENLLMTPAGLKLLDFGVARIAGEPLPSGAVLLGTPPCMSPEQVTAQEIDFRADVYSAGILAYRLLTGRYPFTGGSPSEVMLKHLREMPVRPEGVPGPLVDVVLRSLAKNREERFADGAALFEALKRASQPAAAPRSAPMPAAPPVNQMKVTAPPVTAESPLLKTRQRYEERASKDHYAFLKVPVDADGAVIARAIALAREELRQARRIAGAEAPAFDRLLARVEAADVLTRPETRARYDAALGNFQGVARAVRDGLSPDELLRLQSWFASAESGRVAHAARAAEEADEALRTRSFSRALALLERALTHDPLDLRLHQKYWRLKNQAPAPARPQP